jgi:hypothetical protein
MQEISTLMRQLDEEENIEVIRGQIIDFISGSIAHRGELLDTWERMHFANAISSLNLGAASPHQTKVGWLRLCLSDLRLALTPKLERGSAYAALDIHAEDMDSDQLLKALGSIVRTIEAVG